MANIKITLDHDIVDGESVTFKAPCDCTEVTGIKVYYKVETEEGSTDANKTFTFRDAHCEALTNIGNLFKEGAYITALLDTTNNYAFIQNADTNKYLEGKASAKKFTATLAADGWEGTEAPYTQTVAVNGMLATYEPIADVEYSTSFETRKNEAVAWGKVSTIVTGSGNITAYCDISKPTVDLSIKLLTVVF